MPILAIHAKWLKQIEIYFSMERRVPTPADAASLAELAASVLGIAVRSEVLAQAFEWRSTWTDVAKLLQRLALNGNDLLHKAA